MLRAILAYLDVPFPGAGGAKGEVSGDTNRDVIEFARIDKVA